jgi:hypothetical protein
VGAPRIHGELLKLGIEVGERQLAAHVDTAAPAFPDLATFLANHVRDLVSNRFLHCPHRGGRFRVLFVLVVLATIADASSTST